MRRILVLGVVCLMLVCPLADESRAVAVCNSSALTKLADGVGNLSYDTMNLDSALADFSSAVSFDGTCSPAYAARAMVRVAQSFDTTLVKNLRLAFGDTSTYATATTDTHPHSDKNYVYDADTMDADDFQAALAGPILTLLNSALSDLLLVENGADTAWQLDVPGRFISNDRKHHGKNYEVDIADIYAMHSAILAAKAVIHIATAYNFNAGRDWREFKDAERDGLPDGDTALRHIQNNSGFFALRTGSTDSFSTAHNLIQSADTVAFRFFTLVEAETDVDFLQDTELLPYIGGLKNFGDTAVWEWVNETDVLDYTDPTDGLHFDSIAKFYNGGTFIEDLDKENDDLGIMTFRPKSFIDTPITRNTFPSLAAVQHGFEFNEAFFPDPTFGGILPGATNNDLFLLFNSVDTYYVVTAPNTLINVNTAYGRLPDEIDVRFNLSTSGPVKIQRTDSQFERMLVVTPLAGVVSHLRIFYKKDENFTQSEKAQMRGEIDSSLLYIVPWYASGGHAAEAGLSLSNFSSKFDLSPSSSNELFETMSFTGSSTQFDTIIPFRFGSDADPSNFNPIPSSNAQSMPGKLKVGIALNRFGWFLLAEQKPFFKPVRGFLEGDTGEPLDDSFIVKVVNSLGQPVSGVEVTFNLPGTSDKPSGASQGSFDSNVQTTNALGLAQTNYRMGDKPGVYKITVTASDLGTAFVFAFTTGYIPHPANIWRMVSMPVYPGASLPSAVGDTASMCNLGLARYGPEASVAAFIGDDFSSYKIYEWDPSQTNPSSDFNDAGHRNYVSPSSIAMGKAYWIKTTVGGVLDAVNSSAQYAQVDEDGTPETVVLPLHGGSGSAGWNQVGTPYAFSYLSDNLYVDTDNDGFSLPIDSIPTTFITHQLYWIAPSNSANPGSGGYSQGPGVAHAEVAMFPFGGYWIKADQACTLVFSPYLGGGPSNGEITDGGTGGATGAPPFILMSAPGLARSSTNWTIQLYVQSAAGADYENFAGVRPTTANAPSYYEPPLAPGGASLAFVDGGKKYSQHMRVAGEIPTWTVEVRSTAAGPVTINTSNVSSVPEQMPVMLRDETTGEVVSLRAGSYTYHSNPDETRQFTFAAATLAPGAGSGLFTKVVQPQVCLISRMLGRSERLEDLRALRDGLLGSKPGRLWVSLYYALFSSF